MFLHVFRRSRWWCCVGVSTFLACSAVVVAIFKVAVPTWWMIDGNRKRFWTLVDKGAEFSPPIRADPGLAAFLLAPLGVGETSLGTYPGRARVVIDRCRRRGVDSAVAARAGGGVRHVEQVIARPGRGSFVPRKYIDVAEQKRRWGQAVMLHMKRER